MREIKEDGQEQDWLRNLIEWLLQELVKVEFTEHLAADPWRKPTPNLVADARYEYA